MLSSAEPAGPSRPMPDPELGRALREVIAAESRCVRERYTAMRRLADLLEQRAGARPRPTHAQLARWWGDMTGAMPPAKTRLSQMLRAVRAFDAVPDSPAAEAEFTRLWNGNSARAARSAAGPPPTALERWQEQAKRLARRLGPERLRAALALALDGPPRPATTAVADGPPDDRSALADLVRLLDRRRRALDIAPRYRDRLVRLLARNQWLALEGPPGCWKSSEVERASALLGRPFFKVQGHGDLTIEELRGSVGLRGGDTFFTPGTALRAVEAGGILLVDEANACRPEITIWLNDLAPGRRVHVPESSTTLTVPDGFTLVLAFNDGGLHGTRPINQATMDRFVRVDCDYLEPAAETELLQLRYGPRLPAALVDQAVRAANGVRAARRDGERHPGLEFEFSFRTLVQWLDDAADTGSLRESLDAVVLPKVGSPVHERRQRLMVRELCLLVIVR